MADTYTETTTTSWGSRLGNSFRGVITGIVLVIVGTGLLWWNEGRTVRTGDAIAEAQMAAEELPDISRIDPAFNGKLVHASGVAKATAPVSDEEFGVRTQAIAIRRSVEYYQWVESTSTKTEKKLGGGEEKTTTYSYDKKWVSSPVDSGSFKVSEGHENSLLHSVKPLSDNATARTVRFGAYRLSESQIRSIGNERPLSLSIDQNALTSLQQTLFPGQGNRASYMVQVSGSTIYLGFDPASPKVGDVRITYSEVPDNQTISLIAQVNGDSFKPWKASNGKSFSDLTSRQATLDEMIQSAEEGNAMMAWILRVIGVFVVVIGFKMILAPLSVIADVIPLLGDIVGLGTGFVAWLVGIAWSLIVIALAWIRFRPIVAGTLLAVAAVCVVVLFMRKKQKAPAAA